MDGAECVIDACKAANTKTERVDGGEDVTRFARVCEDHSKRLHLGQDLMIGGVVFRLSEPERWRLMQSRVV